MTDILKQYFITHPILNGIMGFLSVIMPILLKLTSLCQFIGAVGSVVIVVFTIWGHVDKRIAIYKKRKNGSE